tara:strand:+ start:1 stop:876 length:876 start_codon:yes stop_codon:yes gene_type:complete
MSFAISPLISYEKLTNDFKNLNYTILDIRDTSSFKKGHIEGSVSAPYKIFRGNTDNPGKMLETEILENTFEKLGLSMEKPIIIISQGNTPTDFGAAARVYWTLKSSGFEDLAILNGGIKIWKINGSELTQKTKKIIPTDLNINFSYEWTATTNEIKNSPKNTTTLLIDARPSDFYNGNKKHKAAKVPGTIPSSENFDFNNFFVNNSTFLTEIGIKDGTRLLDQIGFNSKKNIISFCNTGHWAATNWFVMSELIGKENVKLYPGSMVEYTNLNLPIENSPGLIKNLLESLSN